MYLTRLKKKFIQMETKPNVKKCIISKIAFIYVCHTEGKM